MNRLTRKILVTVGAAVTLGATGGAALAANTAPAATALTARTVTTSAPRCLEQNLSADLHGAEATGDHLGFILTLTNQGQRSCSVDGYAGLGLQDWNHHAVPSRTFWGSTWFDRDPGRHQIVLSPGETASASLAFTTGSAKGAVDAAYLVVTPPNDYDHMVIGPFSRSMEFPIYHGDLYVTAMAYHTPHR